MFMRVPDCLRLTGLLLAGSTLACDKADRLSEPNSSPISAVSTGQFKFSPLPTSAACTAGGNPTQPFLVPAGYTQTIIAREGDGGTTDLWDMNTQNETGAEAGRFLYRAHEVTSSGQVSVTDLETNLTRVLATRPDWERLDGIAWTPSGTIITAEETGSAAFRDPAFPQALAGLVYEIDPVTGGSIARPRSALAPTRGFASTPWVICMVSQSPLLRAGVTSISSCRIRGETSPAVNCTF